MADILPFPEHRAWTGRYVQANAIRQSAATDRAEPAPIDEGKHGKSPTVIVGDEMHEWIVGAAYCPPHRPATDRAFRDRPETPMPLWEGIVLAAAMIIIVGLLMQVGP